MSTVHTIKFWNANAWHVFDEFERRDDCVCIARKLAELFKAVEIHSASPCGEYVIERI